MRYSLLEVVFAKIMSWYSINSQIMSSLFLGKTKVVLSCTVSSNEVVLLSGIFANLVYLNCKYSCKVGNRKVTNARVFSPLYVSFC
jgi:hypothetical protein